jgi:AraC-like DNA-binding protein
MEKFSTFGLPTAGRAAAWNALYAQRMSRVGFTPEDLSQFDAELRIGQIGPVKLAKLSVDCCSIERTHADLVFNSPRLYSFLLQAKGKSTFYHCGNEAHLTEGDFVLCDTALPHYWVTHDPSTTIMVRVEPTVLREYLPAPEQFCGLHLGRAVGLTDTVSAMVQSLTSQVERGIDAAYEGQVARHLLEMISMSYTMGFGGSIASATLWQRRKDIIRYIEENLRDPQLTPGSIASGLRVSPRYLRTIFSISGERVSAYVLRRRLEECARQICNPAWNGHTLTEIAFSWGFNSSAYFTRSFHEQFGTAPGEYRRSAALGKAKLVPAPVVQ